MSSAQSSTPQTESSKPKQDIQVSVKEIRIVFPKKSFHFRSKISLASGDVKDCKSYLGRSESVLNWVLNPSLVIDRDKPLNISWKATGRSGLSIEVSVPYDHMIAHLSDGNCEYTADHQNEKVIILFESITSVELARKRKSVISRLGASERVLNTVTKIGDALGEIHPAVKVSLLCINGVLEILKSQEADNSDIVDLATDLVDFMEHTFVVEEFTETKLKEAISDTNELSKGVDDLIAKRANRGSLKEIKTLLLSEDRQLINQLQANLDRLKQKFDRGIHIQNAVNIASLEATLKQYEASVKRQEAMLKQQEALLRQHVSTQDEKEFISKLERAVNKEALSKRCFEKTRQSELESMHAWSTDFGKPNIMWLNAYPGTGKSTIVAHFANQLRSSRRRCITYAFDRNVHTKPADLWCSFAYQIVQQFSICRDIVVTKLRDGVVDLDFATSREVFRELIIDPLRHLVKSDPPIAQNDLPIFVIDALDECGGLSGPSVLSARKEVMSQITQWSELVPEFKLIVTSRPEDDITESFSRTPFVPLPIITGDSDPNLFQDVTSFVRYRFETMTVRPRPPNWPGEEAILDLARRSGGIFIWAVTALEFIEEYDPINRLRKVQGGEVTLKGVNTLYHQILDASFSDDDAVRDFTKLMSAVIVMQRFLTPSEYASLLGMDVYTVHSICGKLRSVLDSGTVLQVKHASFVDFLVTGESQSDFRFGVNPDDGHRLLAESAFRVMNKELRFNICDMSSSFIANDTLGLAHFARAIGPILGYACRFWGYHIERTRTKIDGTMIVRFMCLSFLSWLEAMSGLGRSYFAFHSLKALSKWAKETEGDGIPGIDEDTKELISDGTKFSQYFAPAMARSAAHVYVSAIPFAPKNSKISQLYAPKLQQTVTLRSGQLTDWPSDSEWNVFRGHHLPVYSVAFSPDGNHVISASADNTIRIWEIQTRRTVAGPFKGHTDLVWSVGYSPDGQRIVSGSSDKTIRIWDVRTGETVLGPLMGHDGLTTFVTFTLDGKYIISASFDKTIRIWNATTGAAIMGPLQGHNGPVISIALSPDGMHFASGSSDGTVLIWEIKSEDVVGEPFKGHEDQVWSVCYSPDGERVVSGSADGTMLVWDVRTGQTVAGPFTGHQAPITSVTFSPNGKYIVSGSFDKTIRVWEMESGCTIAGSFTTHTDRVRSVTFSGDSKNILSGSEDSTIRIWDVDGGRMSESGIRVWDLKDETDANQFDRHANAIDSIAFSPDGAKIVSGSLDSSIRIWNIESGKMAVQPFKAGNWCVYCVAYSPDGNRVASGSQDSAIWIFDVETGEVVVGPMRGHDDWINSVDFSADGELIASGSKDKTIRIWNARTGQLEAGPFIGHEGEVRSVAFSPTSKFVASGSFDETVRVWSIETGEMVLGPLRGHSAALASVAYSPCGKFIASGSWDETIIIWNSETGEITRGPLIGHTNTVASVCYSPNGKYIASGSYDRTVRVWNVETGETVFGPFNGHGGLINCVAFSPDGNRVASCSDDKTIRIWELFTRGEQPTAGEETSIDCAEPSPVKDQANNLFTDWCKRDADGWVIGEEGELLFWIPPHNASLRWPSNLKVIGEGETVVDCDSVCWGDKWTECYKPL